MQWVQPISGQAKKLKQQDAKGAQLAAAAQGALFRRSTNDRKKAGSLVPAFFLCSGSGHLKKITCLWQLYVVSRVDPNIVIENHEMDMRASAALIARYEQVK